MTLCRSNSQFQQEIDNSNRVFYGIPRKKYRKLLMDFANLRGIAGSVAGEWVHGPDITLFSPA